MSAEVLVFPDAAKTAILFLRAQLVARSDSAVVGDRVPKDRGRFVTVHRTGGQKRQIVLDDSNVVVTCWAETAQEATDLAQLCRGLLGAMPGVIANVVLVTDVDLADQHDPQSDQPLSPFAVQISMRGTAVTPVLPTTVLVLGDGSALELGDGSVLVI